MNGLRCPSLLFWICLCAQKAEFREAEASQPSHDDYGVPEEVVSDYVEVLTSDQTDLWSDEFSGTEKDTWVFKARTKDVMGGFTEEENREIGFARKSLQIYLKERRDDLWSITRFWEMASALKILMPELSKQIDRSDHHGNGGNSIISKGAQQLSSYEQSERKAGIIRETILFLGGIVFLAVTVSVYSFFNPAGPKFKPRYKYSSLCTIVPKLTGEQQIDFQLQVKIFQWKRLYLSRTGMDIDSSLLQLAADDWKKGSEESRDVDVMAYLNYLTTKEWQRNFGEPQCPLEVADPEVQQPTNRDSMDEPEEFQQRSVEAKLNVQQQRMNDMNETFFDSLKIHGDLYSPNDECDPGLETEDEIAQMMIEILTHMVADYITDLPSTPLLYRRI